METRLAPEQYDSLPEISDPREQALEVTGHDMAVRFLVSSYRGGDLPHAILLGGQKGIGKATLAFQFARYLLANPDSASAPDELSKPDVASSVFRQVASGAHPGLHYLARPWDEKTKKFKSAITVDEIRSISGFVSMTSHDRGYRVIIIDSADDMNRNAANALLKNLEEPPSRTVFLLITHAPGRLLPTIRSRCQMVRLPALSEADVNTVLDSLHVGGIDEQMMTQAVARCGGSVRQALLLTQFGGIEIFDAVEELIAEQKFDPAIAHRVADAVATRGRDVQFELFNQSLLDILAERSRSLAGKGASAGATKMSDLWSSAAGRIAETRAYNLDRRQHVIGLLHTFHDHTHS